MVQIPPSDRLLRLDILRCILKTLPIPLKPTLDVSVLEHRLEGFSGRDLRVLADRVALAAASRHLGAVQRHARGDLPQPRDSGSSHSTDTLALTAESGDAARAEAAGRGGGGGPEIGEEDLEGGREGFVPLAMRGMVAAAVQGWEEIGGMAEAKAALLEVVELPTRFPHIFAKAPLRCP